MLQSGLPGLIPEIQVPQEVFYHYFYLPQSLGPAEVELPVGRARHGRQLPGVHPTHGKVHRGEPPDVAVCAQLDPLSVVTLAADGGVGAIRQG